jgi:hypothetical protein
VLAALVAGCGSGASSAADPTVVPIAEWASAEAAAVCARVFSCCSSSEIAEFGYPSLAACQQAVASEQAARVARVVASKTSVYDEHAARACLDEVAAQACVDQFPQGRPVLSGPSCGTVFTGVGKAGDVCSDDAQCESADCESGACLVPPCSGVSCPGGYYCDPTMNACAPIKLAGALCAADDECDPLLGCHDGTCGPTLAVGIACGTSADCAAGSCQPAPTNPPTSTCVAPLPDGSPCSIPTECASGGCSYAGATGGLACGPIVCAGAS